MMNRSRQPSVLVNVYCWMNQDEPDTLAAVIARRENVAVYACDFVRFRVVLIVNDAIYPRLLTPFTRFEFFASICGHYSFPLLVHRTQAFASERDICSDAVA